MTVFLSGAVATTFIITAIFFLKFWRKTSDRFFLALSVAFVLFGLNQIATGVMGPGDERTGYAYLLRVLGFTLISIAILMKNVTRSKTK